MGKLLISEDRIRGRRLVLKNGQLVVEKVKALEPDQIAMLTNALTDALDWEEKDRPART